MAWCRSDRGSLVRSIWGPRFSLKTLPAAAVSVILSIHGREPSDPNDLLYRCNVSGSRPALRPTGFASVVAFAPSAPSAPLLSLVCPKPQSIPDNPIHSYSPVCPCLISADHFGSLQPDPSQANPVGRDSLLFAPIRLAGGGADPGRCIYSFRWTERRQGDFLVFIPSGLDYSVA